jgi:peptide-methionine (S)-S-oxide reductase
MTKRLLIWTAIVTVLVVAAVRSNGGASEIQFPDPAVDAQLSSARAEESIVVAGGCFWGVQAVFQHVKGVEVATSGYAGGTAKNAKYEVVSTGTTGHAESVRVVFDRSQVTLGQLLKIFFSVVHDPTELNRQGPDEGTQYRSAIFYSGDAQKQIAAAYVAQLNDAKIFKRRIVTQIAPLDGFFAAETYHQDYFANNPFDPYIVINDRPKVENLRKLFAGIYVKQAAGWK